MSIIQVRNVTKIYKLYDKPIDRLKESLGFGKKKVLHKEFHALRDVSFDVKKGESVGIIGVNGSGKSTMLKIITGVLRETSGYVKTDGTVSALLELGAGFNLEYTGRENVYMNGTMMGFSRKEMDEKLPEILKFADIGDFIDQPVKAYSSGMFVRLAFALAINVEPEILIVDEALSVGDIFFQAKCYHRMDELRKKGTTILMVTHDMSAVLKYCDKVVLLSGGRKVSEGKPWEMVDLYKRILAGQYRAEDSEEKETEGFEEEAEQEKSKVIKKTDTGEGNAWRTHRSPGERPEEAERPGTKVKSALKHKAESGRKKEEHPGNDSEPENKSCSEPEDESGTGEGVFLMRKSMTVNSNIEEYGNGKAQIFDYGITDSKGKLTSTVLKGERFTIKKRVRFKDHIESPIFTFTIKDKRGTELTGTNTMFEDASVESVSCGDIYDVGFTQKMTLQGGEYLISMSCTGFEKGEHTVYHRLYNLLCISVISNKNTVGVYDMDSIVSLKKNTPDEHCGMKNRQE